MYSIRPHSSGDVQLDLPTTMYAVRPIIGAETSSIEAISREQDRLLEKIEQMFRQLELVEEQRNPRLEELVVHLSTKKPSAKILQLLAERRDEVSVRVFRHSSAGNSPEFSAKGKGQGRSVALIWSDRENLPSMHHAHMTVTDEEQIVNLLQNELNKNKKN